MEVINLTNTEHFYTIMGHYLRSGDFPKNFIHGTPLEVYEFVVNLNDFITYKRGNNFIIFKVPIEFIEVLDNLRKDYRELIKDCTIPKNFISELKELFEE